MKTVKKYIPYLILFIGILLRIREYLTNRSLWVDEAFVALNIINKSYRQLLGSLDYEQHAPFLFLWIMRLMTQLFGTHEYALRFFPLLCGIIALLVFFHISRKLLRPPAALFALTLFAFSDFLVYYSAEVKQYSMDVVVGLFLYFVWFEGSLVQLAITGLFAVWISQSAILVALGIGLAMTLKAFRDGNGRKLKQTGSIVTIWVVSFMIMYVFFIKDVFSDRKFLDYWQYVILVPRSLSEIAANFSGFISIFQVLLGHPSWVIGLVAFCVGLFIVVRQDKIVATALILPLLFALLLSGFHAYPLIPRLFLFVTPSLVLFIAIGISHIVRTLSLTKSWFLRVGSGVCVVWLLYGSVLSAVTHISHGRTLEELRPVLRYYQNHLRPEDQTYVFYASIAPWRYYTQLFGMKDIQYAEGIESRSQMERYHADIETLRGNPRVWFVFSHDIVSEEAYIIEYLDRNGIQLDSYKAPGASLYLYDLSGEKL